LSLLLLSPFMVNAALLKIPPAASALVLPLMLLSLRVSGP